MSLRYGANNSKKIKRGDLGEAKRPSLEFVDADGSKTGTFKGFEKLPKVLVERFDITPFLSQTPVSNSSTTTEPETEKNKPIKPILKESSRNATPISNSKCSVYLFNDDLQKLKEIYNKKLEVFDDLTLRAPSNMSLKCKICKKVYSSEKKLQNHQKNKHMIIYKSDNSKTQKRVSFSDKVIIHELKEYHKCRKCTKIFESYKMLKGHMKEEHKKRKCYICHHCKKNFVDRMFFKVHIKLHCDACGLLFSSKTKCTDHKRNVCKTLKYYKCKTCQLNFFKLMDLKDHSYEHNSPSNYVCDICKDQCFSKCAVSHHIQFLHSKKHKRRNPLLYITKKLARESLFLCRFCDETSLDKDLIEKHVSVLPDLTNRAMTGYKDYYFCDQCLKKFARETDMLQHKWTHFLKTPDNSQLRPQPTQKTEEKKEKTLFNVNEKIPESFQPKLVLEKIKIDENPPKQPEKPVESVDVQNTDNNNEVLNTSETPLKKPLIDPKSKKTLLSKHQCQHCGKYYSTNYCLNRHIETQHSDFENLRCKVCEEVFVWPSLLASHKCIRLRLPEMPFDDARPEIQFDNLHEIGVQDLMNGGFNNGFDDLNIDTDDYMNSVDFEIPAPIVELTEQDNVFVPSVSAVPVPNGIVQHVNKVNSLQNLGYKIVMQEVPIEF